MRGSVSPVHELMCHRSDTRQKRNCFIFNILSRLFQLTAFLQRRRGYQRPTNISCLLLWPFGILVWWKLFLQSKKLSNCDFPFAVHSDDFQTYYYLWIVQTNSMSFSVIIFVRTTLFWSANVCCHCDLYFFTQYADGEPCVLQSRSIISFYNILCDNTKKQVIDLYRHNNVHENT